MLRDGEEKGGVWIWGKLCVAPRQKVLTRLLSVLNNFWGLGQGRKEQLCEAELIMKVFFSNLAVSNGQRGDLYGKGVCVGNTLRFVLRHGAVALPYLKV